MDISACDFYDNRITPANMDNIWGASHGSPTLMENVSSYAGYNFSWVQGKALLMYSLNTSSHEAWGEGAFVENLRKFRDISCYSVSFDITTSATSLNSNQDLEFVLVLTNEASHYSQTNCTSAFTPYSDQMEVFRIDLKEIGVGIKPNFSALTEVTIDFSPTSDYDMLVMYPDVEDGPGNAIWVGIDNFELIENCISGALRYIDYESLDKGLHKANSIEIRTTTTSIETVLAYSSDETNMEAPRIALEPGMRFSPGFTGRFNAKAIPSFSCGPTPEGCLGPPVKTFTDSGTSENKQLSKRFNGLDNVESITIGPNPSDGVIYISAIDKKLDDNLRIEIYSVDGSLVYSKLLHSAEHFVHLGSKGLYIVRVLNDESKVLYTNKLVVN